MWRSTAIFAERIRNTEYFLIVLASRVTSSRGLFLRKKLTEKYFQFFRPSKSGLQEEERLDELCTKTLPDFHERIISSGVVNGEKSILNLRKTKEFSKIEVKVGWKGSILYKNGNRNGLETSDQCKTLSNNSFQTFVQNNGIRVFNILFPDFLQYKVNHVRNSFIISQYFKNSSQNLFEKNQPASLNITQRSEKLTVYNFQGEGNCWIYGMLISRFMALDYEYEWMLKFAAIQFLICYVERQG